MATVNLAKALKLKNSLVTEINRAKGILTRENSRSERSTSKVDRNAIWDSIVAKTVELVALKGKITTANIGIYPMLAEAEELKSTIAYLQSLPTTDGVQVEGGQFGQARVETKFEAYFTQEKIDATIATLQKRIEDTQDAIDTYNATKTVEV